GAEDRSGLVLQSRRKNFYLAPEERHKVGFHVANCWFKNKIPCQRKTAEEEDRFRVGVNNRFGEFHPEDATRVFEGGKGNDVAAYGRLGDHFRVKVIEAYPAEFAWFQVVCEGLVNGSFNARCRHVSFKAPALSAIAVPPGRIHGSMSDLAGDAVLTVEQHAV